MLEKYFNIYISHSMMILMRSFIIMWYTYDIIGLFVIACQFGSIGDLECFDMAAEKTT